MCDLIIKSYLKSSETIKNYTKKIAVLKNYNAIRQLRTDGK